MNAIGCFSVDTAQSQACPLNNGRGHFPDLIFPEKMVQRIYSQSCECSGVLKRMPARTFACKYICCPSLAPLSSDAE